MEKPVTTKDLSRLIDSCIGEIKKGNNYSLFGLQMEPSGWYVADNEVKAGLDRYLTDKEFSTANYDNIFSGPLNRNHNSREWAENIGGVLSRQQPGNLIFYLRNANRIAARILIPTPEFYGGLTNEEILAKYGEELTEKMKKEPNIITLSPDKDGRIRTPFSDLDYAFRKVTGQKTSPEEWD